MENIEEKLDKIGIHLDRVETLYSQAPDSCDENKCEQELKVWNEDAGSGRFYVMSTERWAFDDIDDFILILQDIKSRMG